MTEPIVVRPGTSPAVYKKLKAQAEATGAPLVFVDRTDSDNNKPAKEST